MGITDMFKRFRNQDQNTEAVGDTLLSALLSNSEINREQAMSLPEVSAAVNKIADAISVMPIKLYKESDGKVTEVTGDIRTVLLNDNTGDTLDGVQFKRALVEDYLMGKGGYAVIGKRGNKFTGLYYVKDSSVSPLKNTDPVYKTCSFTINGRTYHDFDILRILRNTHDGVTGKGVTREVAKAIETAYQSMLYQLQLVRTGGNKKGFLTSENRLDKDTIDTLKESWRKLYSSSSENIVVLNKGIKFQESSSTNTELQLLQTKQQLSDEISNIFHVSDDDAKFFKYGILPVVAAFESALNKFLLLEREKKNLYFAFDTSELTRGSLTERFSAYNIALSAGWLSRNEVRYYENLDKIDGLDTYNVTLGAVLYDPETKTYFTPNTQSVSTGTETETETGNGDDNNSNDEGGEEENVNE